MREIDDLLPDHDYEVCGRQVRTLARPGGQLLCRFATVNDVHFGEVVSSNLVFGAIVGWLWGRARAVEPAQEVSPRAPLPV